MKMQNVTSYTCMLLQSPSPGCGCRQNSKAVTPLQLNLGQAGGKDISVVCFMGCIVKYHLDSCQYITKYLKTKWPVGKDKCALKGKVRHDGLFFTLCSACCSPKGKAFLFTGEVLFFFFQCLLKMIQILSKVCYSLIPYVLLKTKPFFLYLTVQV